MFNKILQFVAPQVCAGCKETLTSGEQVLCTGCRHELPLTNFHIVNSATVLNLFYGRLLLQQATSLLYYEKKGSVRNIVHGLKYHGNEKLGSFLGKWLGGDLAELPQWHEIDVVIPVPIHGIRLRERGYNQLTAFGKEIAACLQADFREDVLIKTMNTQRQSQRKRADRNNMVEAPFALKPNHTMAGKHILLVDDVITTGMTLEKCGIELMKIPDVKLSIATMAIAM